MGEKKNGRNQDPRDFRIAILAFDCPTLKLLFLIERQAFICLSHQYLAFMLYAKVILTFYSQYSLKIYQILLFLSLKPSNGFSSH